MAVLPRLRGIRPIVAVVLAAVTGLLVPGAAHAAPSATAGTVLPATVGTPAVGFDAVGTQLEGRAWKHLGLRRDRYVIFNDGGTFESGFIRVKWPFLPAQFTTGVDAVSIVFEGRRWKYTFVKGTELVVFFDSGITVGPVSYMTLWPFLGPAFSGGLDALTDHKENGLDVRMVTSGENFVIFNDNSVVLAQGLIRQRWPFLAGQFLTNLDDASIEPENGRKISLYKNNERVVFQDGASSVIEQTISTAKWPFLANFLIA